MTIISPNAGYDIIEAIAFYAKLDKNIGAKLRDAIQTSIDNLEIHSTMYPKVYKDFRRVLVKNFAYAIYYLIELNGDVIIKAVLSQKVSAKLIKQRLN